MDRDPREPQDALVDDWLASVSEAQPPSFDVPAGPAAPASLLDAVSAADRSAQDAVPSPSGAAVEAAAERPRQRYVLFTVAGATYAVPSAFVTEVGQVPKTTLVPHTPAWVRGVTSLRGDVVSVVDLRVFLGLESAPSHARRLLVVRLLDEDFSTGLLVDAVDQIASVPLDDVRPPASPLEGALADFLTGACHIAERFVAVLDLERLLRSPEIRQFDDDKDAKHEERSCLARI